MPARRPPAGRRLAPRAVHELLRRGATSSPARAIVQVDIDARDIGRIYPVAVGIQADARETLAALLDVLARSVPAGTGGVAAGGPGAPRAAPGATPAEAALDAVPIKPQRVYAELRRVLPPDTIVTLDAGAAPAYGYDRLHFTRPRTFLTPLDLGGLGFAFPAALGAKLGRPAAPVLAIHGDGGFLMNAQELETAVRHGIAAVALVLNNNCWGSEKAYQRHFYNARYVGTDLGNPRYDRLAELFGARGYYVERPALIGDVVRDALARRPAGSRRDPDRPRRVSRPGDGRAPRGRVSGGDPAGRGRCSTSTSRRSVR